MTKTKFSKCVTYKLDDLSTVQVADRCAIVNMFGDRPFVQIFDEDGNQTDAKQFNNMTAAAVALVRVHKGGKL